MGDAGSFVFFTTLLACVPLSCCYKYIEDVQRKRMVGTGIGLLIIIGICGPTAIYSVLLVTGNIIAIKCCDIRIVHKLSLMYTWMFLLYIFFSVECTKYSTWLFQNLALRLVGLAFELNIYDKTTSKTDKTAPPKVPSILKDESVTRLSAADIVSYAYFFIGIHRGPYYSWKTFNDHFNSTSSAQGDFWAVTEHKLSKALLLTLGYVVLRTKYPLSMYKEDEFYENYGTDYRFLICMPQLVIYYLESQIIMLISTSAFTGSGFGVYPVKAQAVPGAGPTKLYVIPEGSADKEEYNFSMLKCYDSDKIIMGPKMKDTTRGWDMATRYWFSQYIVKNLISNNFEVRSACSFLCWTIWAGPTIQNIIIALTLWVYIHLESDYTQLYGQSLTGPWDLGFAIMRMFCLFYLAPCFILDNWRIALRYYNSIYWIYHIVLLVLTVAAIAVHKSRSRVTFGDPVEGPSKPEKISVTPAVKIGDLTPNSGPGTSDNNPSTSGNKG